MADFETVHDALDHTGLTGVGGAATQYFSRRILGQGNNTNEAMTISSATYITTGASQFYHDWDAFPATHFLITCYGQSSTAGQTVTAQLAPNASPTNPVSAAGDDVVITNSQGNFSSGWVAVSDAMSGLVLMAICFKTSTTPLSLNNRWLDIAFKIE